MYRQSKTCDEDYLKRTVHKVSLMLKTKCSAIFPLSYSYMCVELTAKLGGKQRTHSGLRMICLETV